MDLVEFLRARFDEDERAAKMATPGPWVIDHPTSRQVVFRGHQDLPGETVVAFDGDFANDTDPEHIARWNPARVLAEVDAKRRIIEEYETRVEVAAAHSLTIANTDAGWEQALDWIIQRLAAPYTNHVDFDAAWLD